MVRSLASSHSQTRISTALSIPQSQILGFRQHLQKGFVNGYIDGNLALPNTKSHSPHMEYIRERKVENKWDTERRESLGSWWWDHIFLASNKTPWEECFISWVRLCKWGGGCYDDRNQHYKEIKTDASVKDRAAKTLFVLHVYSAVSIWPASLEGHPFLFYELVIKMQV